VAGIVVSFSDKLKGAWKHLFGEGFDRCFEPLEAGGLRAVCHHDFPNDPALLAAWEQLRLDAPAATGFHSPLWQKAVYETLGKPGRLRLLVVWKDSQLVAVLPMHVRDDGLLETLAPGVTDYLDPLVHPEHETDAWRVLLKLLAKLRGGKWRNVTLHNVRDEASCRARLAELAREAGFELEAKVTEHCPCITLPRTWEQYLASLDGHERKETRRKVNKVMTRGGGRLVRCSADAGEIAATLAHTFVLMEQAPGEKGEAVRKTLRPLLERAAPAMIPGGQLWLTTLYVNDKPAAVTLQFPHAAGPLLYNCGFDSAQREWSPGVVLTAEIIRQAIESGARVFDLLRGQEPYKYKLGAVDRPLWMVSLRKV
jgi:CelD/BcsL family acetyltransferase involved in cellulose biosynthesis